MVDISRIRTGIASIENEHADHVTFHHGQSLKVFCKDLFDTSMDKQRKVICVIN